MSLKNLSAWTGIAQTAATRLGTSDPDIVRAILAQWTCEQSGTWPPTRNNPGNVARGWAAGLGYSFTVSSPNPQPSNPIVTFSDPRVGALCYADGIRKFSRYARVMAAVRAGDGAAFLKAITDAHYGTGYNCSIGAYRSLGGHVPVGTQSPGGAAETPDSRSSTPTSSSTSTSSGGGTVVKVYPRPTARLAGTNADPCAGVAPLPVDNGLFNIGGDVFPIPRDRLDDKCACPPGFNRAQVDPQIKGLFGTNYVPIDQLTAGEANACAIASLHEGSTFGQEFSSLAGDLSAGIAAGLTAAIGPLGQVLRSTALFIGLVLLVVLGLKLTLSS